MLQVGTGQGGHRRRHTRKVIRFVSGLSVAAMLTGLGTLPAEGQTNLARALRVAPGSGPAVTTAFSAPFGTAWSLNPFSPDFLSLDDYVLLPLAIAKPPSLGHYIPQMATSWDVTPSRITIHLRKGATWQDGSAFTSKDVLTSLELQGVNGNSVWANFEEVKTPTRSSVVFDLKPNVPGQVVLNDILSVLPVAGSQYDQFAMSGLEQDLLRYYTLLSKNSSTAAASPQGKLVAGVLKRLEAFQPKSLVGDGPFEFVTADNEELVTKRWPGFWDASKIYPSGLDIYGFATTAATDGALFSHKLDFTQSTGGAKQILDRWARTPDAHMSWANNYAGFAFLFNDRAYPLTLAKVRQALAYVIKREQVVVLGDFGAHIDYTDPYPDGLLHPTNVAFLGAKVKKLNPYSYSPQKATTLLDSVGFHKRGGIWYLPNGKRFELSMGSPASWVNQVAEADAAATMLTHFGIHTTATAVEQPGYWSQQDAGEFQIDWGWFGQGGLDPLAQLETPLTATDYVSNTEKGIGFGPTVRVPGLGRVDITSQLTREVNTMSASDTTQVRGILWDWARLINRELPYLPFADKFQGTAYSTYRFDDWPNAKSFIWPLLGLNYQGGLVVAFERGLVRPKP